MPAIPPHQLQIGQVLRYPKAERDRAPTNTVDGLVNFYAATASVSNKALRLEAGINQSASVPASDGARIAVVALATSPNKVGRESTPWQDIYDTDNGYVRYYGDNRTPGVDPATTLGNRRLLAQFDLHHAPSADERARAAPIAFFRRVPFLGRAKGFLRFEGFGVLRSAERVTQPAEAGYFTNYVFEFVLLSLTAEHELFDWSWINVRRDPASSSAQALAAAPESWRTWVDEGDVALPRVRRYVARRSIASALEQKPADGSQARRTLDAVYTFYKGQETRFEAVAAWVTSRLLASSGTYRPLGITRAGGDGGFDFIGRLSLGDETFGAVQVVVLGQAKCERLGAPTNGHHVARTVARLRRGWIGAYVTTSYFSNAVQIEVKQDRYPLLLVNGRQLVTELDRELKTRGSDDLFALLEDIERDFGGKTELSDPDQALFL